MLSLLIANKESGVIFDAKTLAQSVTVSTNRTGSPGKLEFSLIGGAAIGVGDEIRLSDDGELLFYGFVFSVSRDRWGVSEVICYDRQRYLKANASYAFYEQSAGDIIRQIVGDLQLPTGQIEDTGYLLPSLIAQDQSCLDIIESAVQETLLNTGRLFVFFDDGDGLSLREAQNMISPVVLGERSLITEYTDKTDIDRQTYNYIKLAQPDEETGRSNTYVAMDSENMARWGTLMLYQTIDKDLNDAQAAARAEATLSFYNRPARSLNISALGVPGLRAGQMVYINIPDFKQFALLEKVTHTYENDLHTMELETTTL